MSGWGMQPKGGKGAAAGAPKVISPRTDWSTAKGAGAGKGLVPGASKGLVPAASRGLAPATVRPAGGKGLVPGASKGLVPGGGAAKGLVPGKGAATATIRPGIARPPAAGAAGAGKSAGKGAWSNDGNRWSGATSGTAGADQGALLGLVLGLVGQLGGKGKGGKGGHQQSSGKYTVDESGGVLGEFTGTISSYNAWKCYGFIDCEDLKALGHGDAFLHGDMIKSFKQGFKVKFTAFLNKDGKLHAKDLKPGNK